MTTYVLAPGNIVEQYPYSLGDLRKAYPQVSFPDAPSDESLAACGVYPVASTPEPAYDPASHTVSWGAPAQVAGHWEHTWVVRELTEAELRQRIPASVTMRQARLALLQAGILDLVDIALAKIENPEQRGVAQIEWEYAAEVDRSHPWVQGLASALGLDDAALDALFATASTL